MTVAAASPSAGHTDLRHLLAGLAPALAPRPRAILSRPAGAPVPADAVLWFREDEGATLVVEVDADEAIDIDATGIDTTGIHAGDDAARWAQITLRVHSSLEAVGMLAAVAGALAARGIACNVVSAYYHDHLFVPWARRDDALAALRSLSEDATP